jgi:hypothetical protein
VPTAAAAGKFESGVGGENLESVCSTFGLRRINMVSV